MATSSTPSSSSASGLLAGGAATGVTSACGQASLEAILQEMRDAANRRQQLEREHAAMVALLHDKQLKSVTSTTTPVKKEDRPELETIEALQSKIRELEKKAELQNVRHEELLLEMASMKRGSSGVSSIPGGTLTTTTITTNNNNNLTFGTSAARSSTATSSALSHHQPSNLPTYQTSLNGMPSYRHMDYNRLGTQHSTNPNCSVVDGCTGGGSSSTERLVANLERDDRLLAELDAQAATTSIRAANQHHVDFMTNGDDYDVTDVYLKVPDLRPHIKRRLTPSTATGLNTSLTGTGMSLSSTPGLTASSLAAQDAANAAASAAAAQTTPRPHPGTSGVPGSQPQPMGYAMVVPVMAGAVPPGGAANVPKPGAPGAPGQPTYAVMPSGTRKEPWAWFVASTPSGRLMPALPSTTGLPPTLLHYDYDAAAAAAAAVAAVGTHHPHHHHHHLLHTTPTAIPPQEISHPGQVDMLDIPGKGRCYVYIARYSYDPFHQSPNENPEAELATNAGDYLLVWGQMDEDGFLDGELLDGRRGLVPSNFVQKLVGEDILDFHQALLAILRDADDSVSTNIAQELADLQAAQEMGLLDDTYLPKHPVSSGFPLYADLDDIAEEEDENDPGAEPPVPAPKQLTLERQLNKCVLIGWNPPENCPPGVIDSYHVYVDGVLKTTVKASERTRALVEGVDSARPHRISVRSITPNRRTSRDAACTMVIGKDVPQGPSQVRAHHVTSTSAVITWLPSNSNHQHAVCVNNVEVRTVRPGVYRHTITGLSPNTVYRVTVRAKNIRGPNYDDKNSQQQAERAQSHIDFRTLIKGLPDPPTDVQVEPGPQDGTLLVTWLPSTHGQPPNLLINSNITGYAVFADGKKVTDVDSPTGDHALIDIGKLIGLNPKHVTVRTKSRDSQLSADSNPTPIPAIKRSAKQQSSSGPSLTQRFGLFRGRGNQPNPSGGGSSGSGGGGGGGGPGVRVDRHGQVVIEPDENLSDKEIFPNSGHGHGAIPSIEITKDSASEIHFSEEDGYRGGGAGPRRGRGPPMHQGGGYGPHGPPPQRGRGGPPPQQPPHGYGRDPQMDPRRGYRGPPRGGGQHPPPAQQAPPNKRVRWFVAMFDYDPMTMSPNPDGCEEELPFTEGDTIKVYGDKDADGFYWGECRGRRGFVPHNMVVEVQDPKSQEPMRGGGPRDRWGDIYASMPVKKMIALYDYDPQELSPNVDAEQVELSFSTGNVLHVFGDMDDDGFFMAELNGQRGLVPSNFLTEAPPDYRNPSGGSGPGARGPPPPPRHQDRRKGCPIDYPTGPAGGPGMRGVPHQGPMRPDQGRPPLDNRRDGRSGPIGGPGGPGGAGGGGHVVIEPPPSQNQQQPPKGQQQQQNTKPMKGVPTVMPDFIIPATKESPTASAPAGPTTTAASVAGGFAAKFSEGPNLMQKLSDMTSGAAEASDLLSKGKELIFMKFGLGK